MIDRTIPYYPVMMVKRMGGPEAWAFPRRALPAGYTFDFYSPKTGKADWCRVQETSEQIDKPELLPGLFDHEYMDRPQALPERMLFVRDEAGNAVSSATLWYGKPFGEEMERIHWVATDVAHQGKGLCRAVLTRLLDRYRELNATGDIYLLSQTFSYPAIGIYRDFGFAPYLGPKPLEGSWEDFEETACKAWALIDEKLSAHRKERP